MLQRTQQLTGQKVKKALSDGIYASLSDVRERKENGGPVVRAGGGRQQRAEQKGHGLGGSQGKRQRGEEGKEDRKRRVQMARARADVPLPARTSAATGKDQEQRKGG